MFEVNDNLIIETEIFQGSIIYTVNNFFKNPDLLLQLLDDNEPRVHKPGTNNNGVQYSDLRHTIYSEEILNVGEVMHRICGFNVAKPGMMCSNIFNFKKTDFNDYQNCYYQPHLDKGYSGIVYLNKQNMPGTNLYEKLSDLLIKDKNNPWKPKKHFKLIKVLESSFNKLVLFDAKKFMHSMAINDDFFTNNTRKNLILFLESS